MNKLFKRLGVTLLGFALAAGVGVGIVSGVKINQVNATDTTFTYTSKTDPTGITSSPAASGYETPRRAQWSSNTGLTLTTSSSFSSVSSVKLVTSTNADDNAYSISCTVGGNNFGSTISMKKGNNQELEFTGTSATGIVQIKYELKGTKKSIYVNSVTITTGGTTTNYTVTFDANGHGTAPDPVVVPSGGKVTKPADPTASGFTFGGWYTEAGCTNEYDFNTSVTSSFTLFAKWTAEGPSPVGDYALVTNISTLVDGDSVVIATDMDKAPVTGVTGFNGNKDATVSTTISEFKKYTVKKSSTNYLLYDDAAEKYIATPTDNEFKYSDSGGSMTVTNTGILTCNSRYLSVNGTMYRFYKTTSTYERFLLYKVESNKSVVSISTLNGTVSAKTGDSSWTISNVSVTGVLSDSPSEVDIKDFVNVSVVEAVPTIEQDGTMDVTLKATSKKDTSIDKTVSVTATLRYVNQYAIKGVFDKTSGSEITVDGIYTALAANGCMIICDGEYGFLIFDSSASASNYEIGDYVTVSGKLNIYNGLYETNKTPTPTISKLTDSGRKSKLSTPIKYVVTGNEGKGIESQKLANRLTSITGVITAMSSSTVGSRSNLTISVNSKSITVTVVGNDMTEENIAAFQASLNNKTEIIIEGVSSYFDSGKGGANDVGFEVEFGHIVVPVEDYKAENFAQDLLTLTDEVCAGYDGVSSKKDELALVWNVLNSDQHWTKMVASERIRFTSGEGETALEPARARYDYIVAKYGLGDFAGRNPTPLAGSFVSNFINDNSTTMIVIISVAVASISLLGVTIFLKKKRAIH